MSEQVQVQRNSFLASFAIMKQSGVPINSVIDIGCADGTFSLQCVELFGPALKLFNIDAQQTYEPSLRKIAEKLGGFYKISAVSSNNSKIRIDFGDHPYWTAVGGDNPDADYVECRTIDSLLAEVDLPGPHLIKMDIEGGELSALLGAGNTLANTAGVILETAIPGSIKNPNGFLDLYNYLAGRNFSLFDLTSFGYRQPDSVLIQVYATYLNNRYEFRDRQTSIMGSDEGQEQLRQNMVARRQNLLEVNDRILSKF